VLFTDFIESLENYQMNENLEKFNDNDYFLKINNSHTISVSRRRNVTPITPSTNTIDGAILTNQQKMALQECGFVVDDNGIFNRLFVTPYPRVVENLTILGSVKLSHASNASRVKFDRIINNNEQIVIDGKTIVNSEINILDLPIIIGNIKFESEINNSQLSNYIFSGTQTEVFGEILALSGDIIFISSQNISVTPKILNGILYVDNSDISKFTIQNLTMTSSLTVMVDNIKKTFIII
jgi:hypothetical protein